MNHIYKIAIAILFCVNVVVAQTTPTKAGESAKSYSEEYGVIVQKNVFLKDRRSSNQMRPQGNTAPPVPVPVEKTYTLIGVVVGDQDSRAYFDHSGNIERHRVGDVLGHGKIAEIEVSGVHYDAQEKQVLIRVGQDLTGDIVPVRDSSIRAVRVSSPVATPPATGATQTEVKPGVAPSAGAVPAAGGGDTSTLSIEERMRRRRQQEAGN